MAAQPATSNRSTAILVAVKLESLTFARIATDTLTVIIATT